MNSKINKSHVLLVFLAVYLILCAGLRTPGFDRDSLTYIDLINRPITELWFQEPTFILITIINKFFFSNHHVSFFLIYATLGIGIKILAISKIEKYKLYALFCYISLYFTLHDLTQIRVGVAAGFYLMSIYYLDKNKRLSLLLSLTSVLFHYVAILGFVIYLFSTKKINKLWFSLMVIIPVMLSSLMDQRIIVIISDILPEFLSFKVNNYIYILNESNKWGEINQYNIYYLGLFVLYIFYLHKYNHRPDNMSVGFNNVIVIKSMSLMLASYYILVPIPILAGRVSEFYGIILICFFPKFLSLFKFNKYHIPIFIIITSFVLFRGLRLNYEILFL